jgi:hypothetical protein
MSRTIRRIRTGWREEVGRISEPKPFDWWMVLNVDKFFNTRPRLNIKFAMANFGSLSVDKYFPIHKYLGLR